MAIAWLWIFCLGSTNFTMYPFNRYRSYWKWHRHQHQVDGTGEGSYRNLTWGQIFIFRHKDASHVSAKDGIMYKLLASTTWTDTDTSKMLKISSNVPRSACKLGTVIMLVSIPRTIDATWRTPRDPKEFNTMVTFKQHLNIANLTHVFYR